jgi:hypothetical protein
LMVTVLGEHPRRIGRRKGAARLSASSFPADGITPPEAGGRQRSWPGALPDPAPR